MDKPQNSPHHNQAIKPRSDMPRCQKRFAALRQKPLIGEFGVQEPDAQPVAEECSGLLSKIWDFYQVGQNIVPVVSKQRIAVKQQRTDGTDKDDVQAQRVEYSGNGEPPEKQADRCHRLGSIQASDTLQ